MNIDFYGDGETFLLKVFEQLRALKIDLGHWGVDHICYRTSSHEQYRALKKEFGGLGKLLIESEVNGRPIATFKLKRPFRFETRTIDLLELPAPKPGKVTAEGFEHIEIVCDVSFAELKKRFSHCSLNESGLAKSFNQELEIELQGCAVKFHQLSLESVVRLEGNERVWSAIQKSRVLETLKPYRPLIAGTFPLGIHTNESDVDVLVTSDEIDRLKEKVKETYGACVGFESYMIEKQEVPSFVARFRYDGVPFEIFGQAIESVEQRAYRHFQLEERLLKAGGEMLLSRVLELRAQGVKTEPAFAKTLGLAGDPYSELLNIAGHDERSLGELIEKALR